MKTWLRFLIVVGLLLAAAFFLHARSRPEISPPRLPLDAFPRQVGDWAGMDVPLPEKVVDLLGPGEFLTRIYRESPRKPYLDLFIGYFPSQRTGNTIHSPQNCLPGAGWTPIDSKRMTVLMPGGSHLNANRYVLAKGADRILVLYWYQSHGRAVASEYSAKFYLVADAIRLNRTDGAIVRVVTPLLSSENIEDAQRRALGFIDKMLPFLPAYIPR